MSTERTVLARVAYEAYAESTGGKTWDGRPMPTFDELPDNIRRAWSFAAAAAAMEFANRIDLALGEAHQEGA